MKSNPPLPRNKQVDAIPWAASKAGTSYGKYMLTLTDKQKQKIYSDYRDYMATREKEALSYIVETEKKKKRH
jgi:hypothetical protein